MPSRSRVCAVPASPCPSRGRARALATGRATHQPEDGSSLGFGGNGCDYLPSWGLSTQDVAAPSSGSLPAAKLLDLDFLGAPGAAVSDARMRLVKDLTSCWGAGGGGGEGPLVAVRHQRPPASAGLSPDGRVELEVRVRACGPAAVSPLPTPAGAGRPSVHLRAWGSPAAHGPHRGLHRGGATV